MKVFLSFLVERKLLASDCSLLGVNLSLLVEVQVVHISFLSACEQTSTCGTQEHKEEVVRFWYGAH